MPTETSSTKNSDKAAKTTRKLVVIDAANAIYRAFFALPPLRAPDGSPTNAALGFASMLGKVIREQAPDFFAIAFDPRGGGFRRDLYPEYKAGRAKQPEDLTAQMPLVRELVEAFGIRPIEIEGYEADDVIGTLVARAPDDLEVTIISTDKDLMQLVSDRVTLLDGMKDRRYGPLEVEERFGVPPDKMLDLRALIGDTSDNIPGVKGIGEKGAAKLIKEWGDLDQLLAHAGDVKAKRAREALQEQADEARLSRELSKLVCDLDLPVGLEDLAYHPPDNARLREIYQRLGFTRLLDALDAPEATGNGAGQGAAAPVKGPEIELELVDSPDALARCVTELLKDPVLATLFVAEAGSAVDSKLVGLAFAHGEDRAFYVPLADEGAQQLLGGGRGIAFEDALPHLATLFGVSAVDGAGAVGSGGEREWIGTDAKQMQSLAAERGLELPLPAFDVQLGGFLLDPAGRTEVASLAAQYLGRTVPTFEDLAGRGAKAVPAGQFEPTEIGGWAAAQVVAIRALHDVMRERLEQDGLQALFTEVEVPLTRVLSRMERHGFRIDEKKLAELSAQYEVELKRIERQIYDAAGEEFLLSSPKQLQKILFEKLELPPLKKTKTGYSTAEDVLEQLAAEHEVPALILSWRRLSKLMSTYIVALPPLVSQRTGRIHPTFNQTGAATGRLSATHPNVQNIPIRTPEGVRIREAFIASEGCVLLSADYSQVELRILAHYSGDSSLIDAFAKGEDIHRRTAAEVAGITTDEVTPDQRARAKAVNFGIIYGSSAFGLANTLKIATGDAKETIDAYFERYQGVRRFLDETVENARAVGHVTTLLGRRRYLPDLSSRNRVLKQAAERMAVNTVIQGTAADLIKKAMVDVDRALLRAASTARVTLQVHDELVLEVPKGDLAATIDLVREAMQDVFTLAVPLVVDVGQGANWREAH